MGSLGRRSAPGQGDKGITRAAEADPTAREALASTEATADAPPVLTDVPHNEMQLREMYAHRMGDYGYRISESGIDFPDWVLLDADGNRVRAEVEHRSSSFDAHRHDATVCDLVVCWEHDWKAPRLPVLELFSGRVYPATRAPSENRKRASSVAENRAVIVYERVTALLQRGAARQDAVERVAEEMGLKPKSVAAYMPRARKVLARTGKH